MDIEPGTRLAIIGSRTFQHLADVDRFVASLPEGVVVISGGAEGVDTRAEEAARRRGWSPIVLRPTEEERRIHGPKRCYLARDRRIVEAADRVVAFHDGSSRGTAYTIRVAHAAGKPVTVYY